MLRKTILLVALLWPFVAAGVVSGLYLQPEGSETVTREIWLPTSNTVDIERIYFVDTKSVSPNEFRELGIDEVTVLLDSDQEYHLKFIYVGKVTSEEGAVQQYKAEMKIEPKFGQILKGEPELDTENQLVTVEMGSRIFWSGDLFWGAFQPWFLYLVELTMAVITAGICLWITKPLRKAKDC